MLQYVKWFWNKTEDYIPKVFLPVQNNNNKYVVINFYSYLLYACTDLDIWDAYFLMYDFIQFLYLVTHQNLS